MLEHQEERRTAHQAAAHRTAAHQVAHQADISRNNHDRLHQKIRLINLKVDQMTFSIKVSPPTSIPR